MGLGNLLYFSHICEFSLLSSTYKQLLCMDLHCIFLCIDISQKWSSLNAQGICELEEKILKVWCASDWEIYLLFGKMQALFPLGLGPKFGPKTALKNPCIALF